MLTLALIALAGAAVAGELPDEDLQLGQRVAALMVELGARIDRYNIFGPSPIKHLIISTVTDPDGDEILWVHYIESDSAGAIRALKNIVHQVAPYAIIAGEASDENMRIWRRMGAWEISLEQAERIYPHLDDDNRFFMLTAEPS